MIMGAFKTFVGLCAIFVAWILIGILNIAFIRRESWPTQVVVALAFVWFLSGPLWAILFLRWRRQRFVKAFKEVEERLLQKTRKLLKEHSPRD